MSSIGHSTGLLLLDGSTVPDDDTYSFRVDSSGLEEFLGWGMSTAYPPLDINPPEGAVHTVYVGTLDDASKTAIRELAGEHVLRYGECRVYTYPEIGPIAAWIAAGSPAPDDEDQTAVAEEILANQQAPVVNQPDPSPVANANVASEPGFVPDDAWETEPVGSEPEVQEDAASA